MADSRRKLTLNSLPLWSWGVLIGVVGVAVKVSLLAADAFPFNADEAVVGLMARHILQGHWPVFFYGQAYMGSLDASLVALSFALLGQSVIAIRVVQVFLYFGVIVTTMQLALEVFGSTSSAILAGLLVAVPTVNVTLYTTVSIGGYGEALLIGNLLLLLALKVHEDPHRRWAGIGWGFLAGLGFWGFGLTLVYSLPSFVLVVITSVKELGVRERVATLSGIIVAGLLGASPWVAWVLSRGVGTAIAEVLGSAIAGASPIEPLQAIGSRAFNLLLFGPTVIWGLRPPWGILWLAKPLLPLALFFGLAVLGYALRSLRHRGRTRAGRWLLAGVALTLGLGFVLTPFGADPSGRYFLPFVVPEALFGADMLSILSARLDRRLAYGWLATVLAFNLWGTFETALRKPPGITTQFDPVTQVDPLALPDLMDFLREHGERRGYTNYWVAYPLAFLSEEELIFVPRLPYHQDFRYTPRDDRYPPYTQSVRESPTVAYITTHHEALNARLRAAFERSAVRWKEAQIGDYSLFYDLSRAISPEELGLD